MAWRGLLDTVDFPAANSERTESGDLHDIHYDTEPPQRVCVYSGEAEGRGGARLSQLRWGSGGESFAAVCLRRRAQSLARLSAFSHARRAVVVDAAGDVLDGPIEAVDQVLARDGRAGLDAPGVCCDVVQPQRSAEVGCPHGTANVLLVGQHKQRRTSQSLFCQQSPQLVAAVGQARCVPRVDHPDDAIGPLKIIAPVRPQRLLATDVPCNKRAQTSGRCSLVYEALIVPDTAAQATHRH